MARSFCRPRLRFQHQQNGIQRGCQSFRRRCQVGCKPARRLIVILSVLACVAGCCAPTSRRTRTVLRLNTVAIDWIGGVYVVRCPELKGYIQTYKRDGWIAGLSTETPVLNQFEADIERSAGTAATAEPLRVKDVVFLYHKQLYGGIRSDDGVMVSGTQLERDVKINDLLAELQSRERD